MASISSLGVGSNLDLSGLLDKLSNAEQQRLTPLTTQQTSFKAKLTAWGVINSSLQKVQTAADALARAGNISTTKVASTNTAFTATVDASAAAGNYSVEVSQLAQAQSLTSGQFTSKTDTIGAANSASRTITISQPGQQKPMTVILDDDQTSLTGIRDAINQQQGSVTANIIQSDDNTYYLSFTSRDTGKENAMTIAVTGDDTLQSKIGYDPNTASTNGLKETVAAKDAQLKINNTTITRSSNTITGAPDGIILNLTQTNIDKPENLSVAKDNTAMKAAIQTFVDTYNSLQTTISSQTKYTSVDQGSTAQNSSNGDLIGDGTLRNIQTRLRSLLATGQSSDIKTLSSLGITQDLNGKLTVDSSKLDKTLTDKPTSVTAFFVGDGATTGFGVQTSNLLTQFLASDGVVQNATDGINKSLKKLSNNITTTTTSINDAIARYKDQFTHLDKLINKLNNTSSYLTKQFSALSS